MSMWLPVMTDLLTMVITFVIIKGKNISFPKIPENHYDQGLMELSNHLITGATMNSEVLCKKCTISKIKNWMVTR
jgi:BarA-like signal transduction histidine kinase